jgi:class 3 adenylate cyclase
VATCPSCGKANPDGFRFCGFCAAPLVEVSARREQRKTVTVLFCDVTGSTELGERLDPEPFRALLGRYFERMKQIVEHHGGTVEKFIGDAVMAVFGVPVVHEDDALRAVKAAVEMREAFPELGIEGRIGIATGEVVAGTEERLVTGDAVNLGARLEQAAQPGEVLLGEGTVRLTRAAIEVEHLEPLVLKGKAEPVQAYRLVSVGEAARRNEVPMIGRDREQHLLAGAWERVVSERSCHLFTILGPPGVGKSRLAAEFLGSLRDARIVRGRCLPYGDGITYWPVVEVIKQVPKTELDQAAVETLGALLGEQVLVTSSEEIASAFRKLLEAAASEEPLIILFDDLHWGEETFLDLVEHIADLSRDAPILLLCIARPELLDRRSSWGGGKLNTSTVLLEPLGSDETEHLIESLADLDESLRERIGEASEGNPLFVEEMIAMVRESSDGEVVVPPTIQALLAARLDQLDSEEREVLQCGSIEGRIFHRGAVLALNPAESHVTVSLTALVRKELVRPDKAQLPGEDAFRFRHLLIRDAAYDALPKTRRAELHERFAGWLEKRNTGVVELDEILGYHLEQGYLYRAELGPIDDSTEALAREAADRLGRAGRRAFTRGDAAAAVNLISRALSLLPADDPARVDLIPNVRVVQGLSGDLGWADRVLTEAVSAAAARNDRRLEAHALVQRGFLRLFTRPEVTAQELVDVGEYAISVFDEVGDELGLARAWRLVAQAHYLARRGGSSAQASARALEHGRRASDRLELREIVEWFCVALILGPTPAQEAFARCRELLSVVEQDPILEPTVVSVLANVEAMQGHQEQAAELLARWRLAVEGFGESIWLFPINFGFVALADDPVAAERDLRPGYEALRRIGERSGFSSVTGLLARAVCAQGRYAEADQLSKESAAAARPNDIHSHILWRTTRARVLAHTGELDAAEAFAREAVAFAADSDFLDSHGDALVDLAEVLVLADRPQEAVAALDQAIQLYEQKGNLLSAGRTRALLDRLPISPPS